VRGGLAIKRSFGGRVDLKPVKALRSCRLVHTIGSQVGDEPFPRLQPGGNSSLNMAHTPIDRGWEQSPHQYARVVHNKLSRYQTHTSRHGERPGGGTRETAVLLTASRAPLATLLLAPTVAADLHALVRQPQFGCHFLFVYC
jgi:hypothetical protein